ncbi:MAG TPA: carbohydrate ABC transporter permease [Actinopolymorphaceae bacterium]
MRRLSRASMGVALAVLALYAMGPLVVLVFNAFKTNTEIASNPLGPPLRPTFGNLAEAWELGNFATTLRNSAILAVGTALGVCIVSYLTAYALARLLRRPTGMVLYLFVSTAVPAQLFIIPVFFFWTRVHLNNSLFGLMLIYWALFTPFGSLLLRAFLVSLPRDIDDAARIDGAGEWAVMTRVILPLARPGLLVVALTTGLFAWNEFFFANTLIDYEELKPISTSLLAFRGQFSRDWGLTSAGCLFMIGPVLVLFLVLQRRFISGLTSGSLRA